MSSNYPATDRQRAYLADLARLLHISDAQLDQIAREQHQAPLAALTMQRASSLINLLEAWRERPADFLRSRGQVDLPGFGS
jgi:hypothetical protein